MQLRPSHESISAVSSLVDPVRRSLFDLVRNSASPVSREDAATALGISRKLATFHLEKLVGVGLLACETSSLPRPHGHVGRRPKLYRVADTSVQVMIPARRPDLLASLLLEGVTCRADGEDPAAAAVRVSAERGHAAGREERERRRLGRLGAERALTMLGTLLERLGFEPTQHETTSVRFRSCPFHPLSEQAPDVVCRMHHAYVSGVVEGLEATTVEAALVPGTAGCCVEVRPRERAQRP